MFSLKFGAKELPLIDEAIAIPLASTYENNGSIFQETNGMPLMTWVRRLKRRGIGSMVNQFNAMFEEETSGRNKASTTAFYNNPTLNRYKDVLLYDATRVVLTDQLGDDYIHASRVDAYKHKSGFIICQGPLQQTIVNFWRMIWQEKSVLIIMVTSLVEEGKVKCNVYFPVSSDEDLMAGPFRIKLKRLEHRKTCEVLLFNVTCTLNGESRDVMLLMYLDWPDLKIPLKPDDFLSFFFLTKQAQMTMLRRVYPKWNGHPRGPPVVVHCSAGVGRSACFVSIDVCLELLRDSGRASVSSIVRMIRLQRRHAVANPLQYLFIHSVVLHQAKVFGMYQCKDIGSLTRSSNTFDLASGKTESK